MELCSPERGKVKSCRSRSHLYMATILSNQSAKSPSLLKMYPSHHNRIKEKQDSIITARTSTLPDQSRRHANLEFDQKERNRVERRTPSHGSLIQAIPLSEMSVSSSRRAFKSTSLGIEPVNRSSPIAAGG